MLAANDQDRGGVARQAHPRGRLASEGIRASVRHAATWHGPSLRTRRVVVLAHGFGCDQGMWDLVLPMLAEHFSVLTFDHVGAGSSDLASYDAGRHGRLEGYAQDVVELLDELELEDVVLVGHSVSAMVAALAVPMRPRLFAGLVMVGPSPRYIDDLPYVGGFSREDIDSLLSTLQANFLGWSAAMAPVIMGNADRPDLAGRLERSFCRTDPDIAEQFARVTFLSDHRDALPAVTAPTLVLQCTDDAIAPEGVGRYVAASLPRGTFQQLAAVGHCPHVSAPAETAMAILQFAQDLER